MTAVTEGATKEISTMLGMRIYHLTSVADQQTLTVPFENIKNVFYSNRSSTATVWVSSSGSTLTFNISTGTPTIDVMVFGD